ncbi:MAG: hypothetical protein VYE64_03260 [Planctomycetota bacterium]|nr:hypothetical protein [Planctomycetota bacterium]
MKSSFTSILCCYLFTAGFLPLAAGQVPRTPKNRLGVDIVSLSDGPKLYGVVLGKTDRGDVKMAIERTWLKKTHPQLFKTYRSRELAADKKLAEQSIQRIAQWSQERAGDALLSTFLEDEKKRIQAAVDQPENEPMFIVPELSQDEIRNVYVQPMERRKITGLAWQNGLANPTITSTKTLIKRLEEKQVDIQSEVVNLVNELPPMPHSDKQWSAKVALVEHVYRPPLEYQGTGSTLFPSGEPLDAGKLLGPILGNENPLLKQLSEQLGLGAPPIQENPDWWKTAREGAERKESKGVFVIRMSQDYTSPEVKVDGHFFAKHVDGSWFEVVHLQAASPIQQQSQQSLERLRQEPQVKQIFDTLDQLGLPGGNPQVELALRHGAATQTALANLRTQLDEFLATYTRQLDTPAVPIR